MRATAALLLGVGLLGVAAGCGSAHRTPASYSARQVRSVFTQHGIALSADPARCSPEFACFDNADESVLVDVFVGQKKGQLSVQTVGSYRETEKGNVDVLWTGEYRGQVRTALRSLR